MRVLLIGDVILVFYHLNYFYTDVFGGESTLRKLCLHWNRVKFIITCSLLKDWVILKYIIALHSSLLSDFKIQKKFSSLLVKIYTE